MDQFEGKAPQAPARGLAREFHRTVARGDVLSIAIERDDLPEVGWRRMAGLRLRPGDRTGPA